MALHYYGYQSCRRNSELGSSHHHHVQQRGSCGVGRLASEPPSESGESGGPLSDMDSDSGGCSGATSGGSTTSGSGSGGSSEDPTNGLPYPGIAPVALRYLGQTTRPRNWCLALISNPWFERISMMVILLNCVTLGMYQPCMDDDCVTNRCKILQIFDDFIFAFFSLEMTIKMVAMGVYGKGTYLADSWNRLDFFIVLSGALEYCLNVENMNLSAIRTIRVLRPLRAINRIPSMRILVMLLLDTLPMLGNVLLLCFFVFFIFGIVGVQLWQGILRQRCYLRPTMDFQYPPDLSRYYTFSQEQEYICTRGDNSGMHICGNLPPYRYGNLTCNGSAITGGSNLPTATSCVNWNQYYTECVGNGDNPFQGTISFDNIGLAWVAIFLVISLEGWTDIMYYVQDAHSFWDWIYFVLLIVIGSFFMINLCLVVIATQFSETKKREMERMRLERARFQSTSTLASSTNNSEPTTCYAEIVKYIAHLWRRSKRRLLKKIRLYKYRRQQVREQKLEALGLGSAGPGGVHDAMPRPNASHHPACPRTRTTGGGSSHTGQQALQSISCSAAAGAGAALGEPATHGSNSGRHMGPGGMGTGTVVVAVPADLPATVDFIDAAAAAAAAANRRPGLLRVPSISADAATINDTNLQLLSPPSNAAARRRSSVMFSDIVLLHGGNANINPTASGANMIGSPGSGSLPQNSALNPTNVCSTVERNVCSSEKMTQTGDGHIWQITTTSSPPVALQPHQQVPPMEYCELSNGETMTCQELLALSGALSAALPTGQIALDSFFSSLTKGMHTTQRTANDDLFLAPANQWPAPADDDFSCCRELYHRDEERKRRSGRSCSFLCICCKWALLVLGGMKKYIMLLVEHKYFQQGILFAILINTLSMGIEYHNQPDMLTSIVETSNIVFSVIFAVEMLLKVIAEGPFGYISNGFNVFDGVIVILSAIELFQTFLGGKEGSSGLSVLRTFRLLRILKLVRFMPNLRRQLFVMLRTMDNVAVFFSLLILFIFIFSILGMNLFGCKFCEGKALAEGGECDRKNFDSLLWALVTVFQGLIASNVMGSILGMILFGGKFCKYLDDEGNSSRECTCAEISSVNPHCECDRKHFNNFLWATVTVFQILTQEDWNMVLSNGMAKTSHWAALYFVALMTFGNYVLFNLLVAILVEGFSSERNERREREQRELAKSKLSQECYHSDPNDISYDDSRSMSEESDSFPQGTKNTWRSAEELRKIKDSNGHRDRHHRDHGQCHLVHPIGGCKSILQRECSEESKCNIQKECKMLQQPTKMTEYRSPSPQPPIITHTAATPQDSPNTTLEPGTTFKEFYYHTSLIDSLDSIDRSSSISIPGLLKPPTLNERSTSLTPPTLGVPNKTLLGEKIAENSFEEFTLTPKPVPNQEKNATATTTFSEKTQPFTLTPMEKPPGDKFTLPAVKLPPTECKIQRGYSWKISRPNIRRKNSVQKSRSGSDSDTILVLNNGRKNSQCNGNGISRQASLKNSGTTIRIQNDTQGDTPNNKSVKGISPQNSIRSKSSTFSSIPQVAWQQTTHRQNSLSTSNTSSQPKTSPWNSLYQYQTQRLSLTPENIDAKTINNLNDKPNESNIVALPRINKQDDSINGSVPNSELNVATRGRLKELFSCLEPRGCLKERDEFSLYIFPTHNRFRQMCFWFVEQKWFDNVVLMFIALNCITLAMERPNIPPNSAERLFLGTANYVFTVVFAIEMFVKVVAAGMCYGVDAYFTSGWNIMDGSLVIISIIDLLMSLISESSPRIFGILRVFRLLRSLRPLRVINRAPGLKLVVQTLLSSLRPIGNIVLICCTFFIIFGILGVQLFKGTFFYCKGDITKDVRNKTDCTRQGFEWVNQKYNFDDLGKALMSLFVLSSRDGWVNIMYTGLDAVGVDQQPIVNYSEWRLLYFIAFILLVGFFVLNMFVGVVVENFHRCREEQEKEERVRRAAKRALQMEKRRRKMNEPPYYTNYSKWRLFIHNVVTSKYFDLAIAAVIGLNVVTMAMECYKMPDALEYALKIFNYFFTAVFILESLMKLLALGILLYLKDKWNQLDVFIVILSVVGIVLEELRSKIIPINPTVLRVMRVLRIARVLKLLKMAKGIRALLDTVMQALPQVGNLGLLFFLLFFIFAALGVELFGRLECNDETPCQGLGEHAHFSNFGMAFLTLFRVATGDNWNGIMKDTLRDECDESADCVRNCCVSTIIAPIFFVIFVLMAQFVLVNVVVAVLMKHLEESHKHLEEENDMDTQLEREMQEQQEEQEERELCLALQMEADSENPKPLRKPLAKVLSLPSNFTYSPPGGSRYGKNRRQSTQYQQYSAKRRQTVHSQQALLPNIITARTAAYSHKYDNHDFNLNEEIDYEIQNMSKHTELLHVHTEFAEDEPQTQEELSAVPLPKNNELLRLRGDDLIMNNGCTMKNINEKKNYEEKTLLNVPHVQKPAQKLYGSTKHLFKQKAIEEDPVHEGALLLPREFEPNNRVIDLLLPKISTESLVVPELSRKTASDTILLQKNENMPMKINSESLITAKLKEGSNLMQLKDFNLPLKPTPESSRKPQIITSDITELQHRIPFPEDVQKIILERRQMDESLKDIEHFDIYEKLSNIFSCESQEETPIVTDNLQETKENQTVQIDGNNDDENTVDNQIDDSDRCIHSEC